MCQKLANAATSLSAKAFQTRGADNFFGTNAMKKAKLLANKVSDNSVLVCYEQKTDDYRSRYDADFNSGLARGS
jgi:hypothetical protein